MLLVHGTGGTTERHFASLALRLASRYRVIGVDLGMPEGVELTLDHLVEQVEAVVASAELSSGAYTEVGYSLGAVVAAAHAARRARPPGRLVLLNGWVRADQHQILRNSVWRGLYAAGSAELSRFTVLTSYSQSFINSRSAEQLERLIDNVRPNEARRRQMELNSVADITRDLAAIECPTLVLVGEHDLTVPPSQGHELATGIRRSAMRVLPCGHAALAELPETVFELIDAFAESGTGPAGVEAG